jgi:phosphatidylserine/phosphatidylglycerophosphate/cardiolipin synthase-like enzyme
MPPASGEIADAFLHYHSSTRQAARGGECPWRQARIEVAKLPKLPSDVENKVRHVPVTWVEDRAHYDLLLGVLDNARVSLWIATANLKDVRLEAPIGSVARARKRYVSITERFAGLVKRGVELRVLHGGPPSRPFRESLAAQSSLEPTRNWLRQCPRVHLKLVAVDGAELYLGSANFTGAGIGAKGEGRRNFELGIKTTDHVLLDAAQRRFDRIWSGGECGSCRMREHCPEPLDQPPLARPPAPAKAKPVRSAKRRKARSAKAR